MNQTKVRPHITAGKYKGRRLDVPSNARPTTERFKIMMFDLLGDRVEGARCLDVFSGSGAFGIEALSRGASFVDFVDISERATKVIKENIERIGIDKENYRVIKRNFVSQINAEAGNYDLIFADPPFTKYDEYKLNRLIEGIKPSGLVCIKAPYSMQNKYINKVEENIILRQRTGKNELIVLNIP